MEFKALRSRVVLGAMADPTPELGQRRVKEIARKKPLSIPVETTAPMERAPVRPTFSVEKIGDDPAWMHEDSNPQEPSSKGNVDGANAGQSGPLKRNLAVNGKSKRQKRGADMATLQPEGVVKPKTLFYVDGVASGVLENMSSSEGDDESSDECEVIGEQDVSDGDFSTGSEPVQPKPAMPAAKHAKPTQVPQRRQIVDEDHVGALVRAYRFHFSKFSIGRKKKTKQLIPKKVWAEVYKQYVAEFPKSRFQQVSLKEHLRDTLKDMTSGVNAPENGDTAEIQNEELMAELMHIEACKRRNILRAREAIVNQASRPTSGHDTSGLIDKPPSRPQTPSPVVDQNKVPSPILPAVKVATKSSNLKRVGDDISEMLSEFKGFKDDRKQESVRKSKLEEEKATLAAAKRHESENRSQESDLRRAYQRTQNRLVEIKMLEKLLAIGLITEEEFKEKCKEVACL